MDIMAIFGKNANGKFDMIKPEDFKDFRKERKKLDLKKAALKTKIESGDKEAILNVRNMEIQICQEESLMPGNPLASIFGCEVEDLKLFFSEDS